MATGRVNTGGTGAKLNLYSQANAPQKREGIWLQHDSNYANIAIDTNPYVERWKGRGKDIPYNFSKSSAVTVGTDIYLLGSNTTINTNSNYKYNTLNNTYTQMRDIPYKFYHGSAVVVGTDIYLLGSFYTSATYKYNYKYNTLNDTYTQMKDIPNDFITGSAVAIGTDIYLFHSDSNYKYNTLNNTYTQMRDIPYQFFDRNSAIAIGTDIYLLGGEKSRVNNYKYNTLNNTYTQMRDIPYQFYYGSAVVVGADIYLFGGEASKVNNYKYNTIGNIYTKMTDIPYSFYNGSAVAMGMDIHLLGGESSQNYVQVYTLELKQYPENTFVLIKTGNYTGVFQTELVSPTKRPAGIYNRFATGFNDAFFYVNGTLKTPKAYYGDGTTWIGFK